MHFGYAPRVLWNGCDSMSRFMFIAADVELPEIDFSGVLRLTVKDLKTMSPRPISFWDRDKLSDDCKALVIPKDADTTGLQISKCTNPPHETGEYIKRKYIYWLGGRFNSKWKKQFQEYVQDNFGEGTYFELWSLWFGNHKMDEILQEECDFVDIANFDFDELLNTDSCITVIM